MSAEQKQRIMSMFNDGFYTGEIARAMDINECDVVSTLGEYFEQYR